MTRRGPKANAATFDGYKRQAESEALRSQMHQLQADERVWQTRVAGFARSGGGEDGFECCCGPTGSHEAARLHPTPNASELNPADQKRGKTVTSQTHRDRLHMSAHRSLARALTTAETSPRSSQSRRRLQSSAWRLCCLVAVFRLGSILLPIHHDHPILSSSSLHTTANT